MALESRFEIAFGTSCAYIAEPPRTIRICLFSVRRSLSEQSLVRCRALSLRHIERRFHHVKCRWAYSRVSRILGCSVPTDSRVTSGTDAVTCPCLIRIYKKKSRIYVFNTYFSAFSGLFFFERLCNFEYRKTPGVLGSI